MAAIDLKTFTGALGIIKINGVPVGKCRDLRISENFQRVPVSKGIGSIYKDEICVIGFMGSVTMDFIEISFGKSGVTDALKRALFTASSLASQVATGNFASNFEDQLLLDDVGVALDVYKKISDVQYSGQGLIIPDAGIYCSISKLFIEGDSVNISDGGVTGRNQTFQYLDPLVIK